MWNKDINFMPAVKCPNCGKTIRSAISGWGGQFNTRTKCCKFCNKSYTLVLYAEATLEPDISMELSHLRKRIQYYKDKIYKLQNKLVDKSAEFAKEFLRVEALTNTRN